MIIIIISALVGQIILPTTAGVVNWNGILGNSLDTKFQQLDNSTKELSSLKAKVVEIQNILSSLKENVDDIRSVKEKISELELQIDKLVKYLDEQEQISSQTQNRNLANHGNLVQAFNELEERLIAVEESKYLKELEEALRMKDCKENLLNNNKIRNETKILEIISRVYREERVTNIVLCLGGKVNNITLRAAIFNTLYGEIFKLTDIDKLKLQYEEQRRLAFLSVSNQMKLIYVLQNYIINIETVPTNLIKSTKNVVNEIKQSLLPIFNPTVMKNFTRDLISIKLGYYYDEDRTSISESELVYSNFDKIDTNKHIKFRFILNTTNSLNDIECWFEFQFALGNRFQISKLFFNEYRPINYNRIEYMKNHDLAMQLELALRTNEYDEALKIYNLINNDQVITDVIKNVCQTSVDIDPLLEFAGRISNIAERIVVLKGIAEHLHQQDASYMCDMLKLIDALENYYVQSGNHQKSNELKHWLTSRLNIAKKNSSLSGVAISHVNLGHDSLRFTINDVNTTLILGRIEVFINKSIETSKIYCYLRGGISIDSYDKWYTINKMKLDGP